MDKSYVTLGLCPICKKENGTILMDKRLRSSLNQYTIDPTNPCDKCKKKYLSKGVLLFDPKTGSLAVIKDEAFKKMFNKPIPKKKIAFCDSEIMENILSVKK